MRSLFRKEIIQFFGSITGTLVSMVFLVVTGLFLWVFSGNYNIPDGGYASLRGLFEIAPWIYLFLIPAVTMRMFSDEKRTGTMELLLTRPVSEIKLIFAKFLAALFVVLLTLLPTLIYFFSVYSLGNPVGCVDTGGDMGKLYRAVIACCDILINRTSYLINYRQSGCCIYNCCFYLLFLVFRVWLY